VVAARLDDLRRRSPTNRRSHIWLSRCAWNNHAQLERRAAPKFLDETVSRRSSWADRPRPPTLTSGTTSAGITTSGGRRLERNSSKYQGHGRANRDRASRTPSARTTTAPGVREAALRMPAKKRRGARPRRPELSAPDLTKERDGPDGALWEISFSASACRHRHVGARHAADAEMEICNARRLAPAHGVSIWAVLASDNRGDAPGCTHRAVLSGEQQDLPAPTF